MVGARPERYSFTTATISTLAWHSSAQNKALISFSPSAFCGAQAVSRAVIILSQTAFILSKFLPDQYQMQIAYVRTIPPELRITWIL